MGTTVKYATLELIDGSSFLTKTVYEPSRDFLLTQTIPCMLNSQTSRMAKITQLFDTDHHSILAYLFDTDLFDLFDFNLIRYWPD